MEPSVAKRPRLEHRNAEEIIQEQKLVIENLMARIQQLEEKVKFLESSSTETKIMTIPIPELPNETWLQIMSYLSTYDVLKNVAQVSKRFHKLSQDPHVIRKIEVNPAQSWPKDMEEKYCDDFLEVLKRSVKLRSLSFRFSGDIETTIDEDDEIDEKIDKSGDKFLEALPFMNHPFLQEVCLTLTLAPKISAPINENLGRYLEECPELKVLKFEFKPKVNEDLLSDEFKESISSLKLKNLQEFHWIGVDFQDSSGLENLPKLKRLCFICKDDF